MKLTNNMSALDRFIRFIIVIAVIVLLWTEVLKGTFATIVGIVGIVFVVTSVYGWCPVYAILKISTKKQRNVKEQ